MNILSPLLAEHREYVFVCLMALAAFAGSWAGSSIFDSHVLLRHPHSMEESEKGVTQLPSTAPNAQVPHPLLTFSQAVGLAVSAGFWREYSAGDSGLNQIQSSKYASWHSFAFDAFETLKLDFWKEGLLSDVLSPVSPALLRAPSVPRLVLLIGDSTDWESVYYGCRGRVEVIGSLGRDVEYDNIMSCSDTWGAIDSVFSFGAAQQGPYHAGFVDSTESRLPAIIQKVTALHGHAPDLVVYQSILWSDREPSWSKIKSRPSRQARLSNLRKLMSDYALNIAALQRSLPATSVLLLRTAPVSQGLAKEGNLHLLSMNAGIRLVGGALGVGVFDWASITANLYDDAMYDPPKNSTLHSGEHVFRQDYIHWGKKMAVAFIDIYTLLAFVVTQEPRLTISTVLQHLPL